MTLKKALIAVVALAICLLTATPVLAASPPTNTACPAARCRDVTVPAPAGVHVPSQKVRVLLPTGYGKTTRRYPVVYLLNGLGGNYTEWTTHSDVTSYSAGFPAIFVMPDGGTNGTAGWYADWQNGTYQFESFHINSVMPYIDQHFRTTRGRNAIVGLSMGGLGALDYAARHPGLFREVASFSGFVNNQQVSVANGLLSPTMPKAWGDPILNSSNWAAHNPTKLAPRLKGTTAVYLACGSGSLTGGSQAVEEYYLNQQQAGLVKQLNSAGVTHHDLFYSGGSHTWSYWQTDLHWAVPQIMQQL